MHLGGRKSPGTFLEKSELVFAEKSCYLGN